ncbi:MAG: hypothetical protein N2380_05800 [bacterium]|nr:hypothetical protein [bacterium]
MEEGLTALEERVDRLESVLGQFMVQTNITLKKLGEEITRLSKQWEEDRKAMNKRWGELANKMGTLVEDIFFPSFEIVLKKYFNVTPKLLTHTVKFRKDGRTLEIDILAYTEDKAFIVEVKSSPDRKGYVEDFIEKLKTLSEFIPDIEKYKVVPIYAGLTMEEKTIAKLTENNIYVMVVKGDILEIVNFEEIK